MAITQLIGELFKPVTTLVDDIHTSEEEKNLKLKKKCQKFNPTFS